MLENFKFKKARPVWLLGLAEEKNITMSAAVRVKKGKTVLYIAASCSYTVIVNGVFAAFGPSRCAHGCYYVDELDLTDFLKNEINTVCVHTAGYNVNSFAYLDQPSFLCAEIEENGKITAATDEKESAFCFYHTKERIQKVPRYSFQRPFVEYYRLKEGAFSYESLKGAKGADAVELEKSEKKFFKRIAPYGEYPTGKWHTASYGKITESEKSEYYTDRSIENIGDMLKGFEKNSLEYMPHIEAGKLDFIPNKAKTCDGEKIVLEKNSYAVLQFERDYAGILSFDMETEGEGTLYALFDEVAGENGVPNPFRSNEACNVICWQCKKGRYSILCAEPYTMKYLCLAAKGMAVKIENLTLHRIEFPMSKIKYAYNGEDKELKNICDAALCSFASNAVDICMDCPSRERAGWLCDSFFTGRVEKLLTGSSEVERAFLTNYLLPESFKYLPEGMVPMCYPADFYNGEFIPSWALWLICELKEYKERSNDIELISAAKKRIYGILNYLKAFENELGLLEALKGWVFVEWSQANDLVQDVNFPVNMLYAEAKEAAGLLYEDAALIYEAKRLRETIQKTAMQKNGFFCDNMYRKNGKLVLSGESTEVCQYYAFYFGVASKESNPELLETLFSKFGRKRKQNNLYPNVHFANSFIGNYLRLELLSRFKRYEQLKSEIKEFFSYMAKETGTLWEHENPTNSCNHGFASHVLVWLEKTENKKENEKNV